jgi:hypothetical protein
MKTATVNLIRYGLSLKNENTQEGQDAAAATIKIAELVEQGRPIADIVAEFIPPEQQLAVVDDLYKVAFNIDDSVKTADENGVPSGVKLAARITRHGFKYAAANTPEGVAAAAKAIKIAGDVEKGASIAEAVVAHIEPEYHTSVIDELYKAASAAVALRGSASKNIGTRLRSAAPAIGGAATAAAAGYAGYRLGKGQAKGKEKTEEK